ARVKDASIREKLLADIAGVTGSIVRRSAPERALPFLSEAIAFQERAGRSVLLPQLHLERGRAYRGANRLKEAEREFDHGIRLLETQRVRTRDPELRGSIFDDSGDLFREAVAAAVARGDGRAALQYVERGRARTMAEEMASEARSDVAVPSLLDAASLADRLPDDGLLLEFVMLEEELIILIVDRSGLAVTRVPVRRDLIERSVGEFREAVIDRRPLDELRPLATRLFSWLLAPVGNRFERARSLVIVPDAILEQIPFAALVDPGNGKYLVQTHLMVVSPSVAVYLLCTDRSEDKPAVLQPTAAIFANPVLDASFTALSSLPAAEREGERVASLYAERLFLRGTEAAHDRFTSSADAYDVIHFAGHTVIMPAQPWHSALLLGPGRNDNGVLSVREISGLSFRRTRLVVLASCSTSQGEKSDVEGTSSIARAFLIAGVPSVLSTLWDVEDEETGTLVAMVHRRYVSGDAPEEALRAAQLHALQSDSPEKRHPASWSVFAMIGGRSARR
ncbi:MAG TPA: CHAT domain-containing protein, partial [Thermoanaerobaculia bacterium]|nr:CHAT domain-containing protein [Thermoanaerobaculia bacterium]